MIPDIAESAPIALDPSSNAPIFSVGQISSALKRTIEQAFSYVRVRGEISGCKRHGSGHVYLCLKDADAVLDAVMWRGTASRLDLRPEDGLEVICTGRLTIFAGRSKYQLVIERMELAGEGALLKLLEDRKRRLAEEGLFAAERKRPIPYLPGVIGVVTSPTGAVIRDILHRLDERFPRHVIVWPVAVQGNGAAQQIAAAITGFASVTPRPDLIIVARGGGSLEDLMPFNEEIVVRAAASCPIPLISAVGHETDTTLIDHAADKRAPTPTAAAEMAVPVRLELVAALAALDHRLGGAVVRLIDERRRFVEGLARGLPDPQSILNLAAQRLDDRTERLALAWETLLRDRHGRLATAAARLQHPGHRLAELQRHLRSIGERLQPAGQRLIVNTAERLAGMGQVLTSLSPYRVLDRGYAVVEGPTGHPVVPENITAGMLLKLRFADALIPARALGGPKSDKAVTERSRDAKSAAGRQPTLI